MPAPFIDQIAQFLEKLPTQSAEFEIATIDGPKHGTKKDGTPWTSYKYTLVIPATRETFERNLFNNDRKYIMDVPAGGMIRGKLNGTFVNWSKVRTTEEGLTDQPRTNYQSIKNERQLSADVLQARQEKADKEYQICVQGFCQANRIAGMTVTDARAQAIEDATWIRSLSAPK